MKFFPKIFFVGVEKSKFANRLKRALPKFRGDRSQVRGVNGRSKFVAASAGFAKRKQFHYSLHSPLGPKMVRTMPWSTLHEHATSCHYARKNLHA